MKKKRTYGTVPVQSLNLASLLERLAGTVVLALDIAKTSMVFAVADVGGEVHALVRFSHPKETSIFLVLVERLLELGRTVEAVMEPTGSYGDAVRYQLRKRGVPVFLADAKRTHDMRAVLDGVDSMHDPKACTVIAGLHSRKLTSPWRERTVLDEETRALLDELALSADPLEVLHGRLEAILGASWPELNDMFDQRARWPLHLLMKYPSAAEVRANLPAARALLHRVTRNSMDSERIEEVLACATESVGAELPEPRRRYLQLLVEEMLELDHRVTQVEKRMRALCKNGPALDATDMHSAEDETKGARAGEAENSDVHGTEKESLTLIAEVVGPAAALAIFADLGSPCQYGSAAALEKAAGLNLREVSSGKRTGQLHITKRGPPRVRAYMYLAALRLLKFSPLVRAWFEGRSSGPGAKKRAVVALTRKLLRALFHVAKGAPFQVEKLFDARKLVLTDKPKETLRAA